MEFAKERLAGSAERFRAIAVAYNHPRWANRSAEFLSGFEPTSCPRMGDDCRWVGAAVAASGEFLIESWRTRISSEAHRWSPPAFPAKAGLQQKPWIPAKRLLLPRVRGISTLYLPALALPFEARMALIPDAGPAKSGWGSLRQLTGYQWFVFIVACLAWDLDCMDQQLFNVARRPAMNDLVPKIHADDDRLPDLLAKMSEEAKSKEQPAPSMDKVIDAQFNADVATWSGRATAIFLIGWATGGIGFGIMGDRFGRVRTLMLTILLTCPTGLSAISPRFGTSASIDSSPACVGACLRSRCRWSRKRRSSARPCTGLRQTPRSGIRGASI